MKISEAQEVLGKIIQLKIKNNRRELAYIRRGPKPENLVNNLGVVSRYVYPSNIDDLTAASEVLSAFVSCDCETGTMSFGRAMSLLQDKSPSADLRIQRVLSARNTQELAVALRPVLVLMRREHILPDFARLLAAVVNFPAWRDNVISTWSLGFYRGKNAAAAQAEEAWEEEAAA